MAAAIESRVLLLAPTARDAAVTIRLLAGAGIAAEAYADMTALVAQLHAGAGAVILTEHAARSLHPLGAVLLAQPSWSELPIIALARDGQPTDPVGHLRGLPGLVLLERPVRARTLLSAVAAALRARQRQYEMRGQFEQIQAANEELNRAARAKDEFVATLAHELRNPLSAMGNAVHLLSAAESRPATATLAREILGRQVRQMTRLLDDLLDVSRITRNRLELRKERTRFSLIAAAAIETSGHVISVNRHRLVLSLSAEEVYLDVDPARISQVLSNLLTNAAKYTEPGGLIEVTQTCVDEEILISVRDTGIGIAPEQTGSIFGMFTQLRPALDRSGGGLGIGLSLAKGLVELHGGSISARSDGVGLGSEFVVRLPVVPGAHPALAVRANDAPSHRTFVAEDNADSLLAVAELLRIQG